MPDTEMTWQSMVDYSREHELLAKQLYVVFSEPTNGLGPILEVVDEHVRYQTKLELDGMHVGRGAHGHTGRAGVARRRPVHVPRRLPRAGDAVRRGGPDAPVGGTVVPIRPWLLNEGSLNVRVLFSGGKTQVI